MDIFGRSTGPGHVSTQVQAAAPPPPPPPPAAFSSGGMTQSSTSVDPRLYMQRHQTAPLASVNQGIKPPHAKHEYSGQHFSSDSFHYDTILPVTENVPSKVGVPPPNTADRSPFAGIADGSRTVDSKLPSEHGAYGFVDNSASHMQNPVSNERDAVNSLFASNTKMDGDSLLSSFNAFSFGGQESESNLGSNFFDFLSQDTSEKPTEERRLGLGGVRLDLSNDTTPNYSETSRKQDPSIWGPQ